MSKRIVLTPVPVQITDGTNYAHVTRITGIAVYADSEDSDYWHVLDRNLNIAPPMEIWMKDENNLGTVVTVTTFNSTSD